MNAAHRLSLTPTRRATLKKYGIDEADLIALLEIQSHSCGMCLRPFTVSRPPCVDHDHRPPELTRGLLCHRCNRDVLGVLRDDVEFFRQIVSYLESPPAARLDGPRRRVPGGPPTNGGM